MILRGLIAADTGDTIPVCATQGSTAGLSRRPAKYRAKKTKADVLPRSCKGSFGTLESQVPQGSIYPTGTRFHIPDFSLISGSPGDKASTWS